MLKIFLTLCSLIIIIGCKSAKEISYNHLDKIPGRYIVFFTKEVAKPVLEERRNDDGRQTQRRMNRPDRKNKKESILRYLQSMDVESKNEKRFADVQVMAVVKMTASKAEELRKDSKHVAAVVQDVAIQINPIQQGPPDGTDPSRQWVSDVVTQINPIQQSADSQLRYEIDTVSRISRAITTAGGPTSGIGKRNVIWFLDSGIDGNNLEVDRSLDGNFVGSSGTGDDFGHGTFCAGVAAGKPIGRGPLSRRWRIGVSEGATVVPVKVLDGTGQGSWSSVLAGLNHVAKYSQPGDIVNISLGAYDPSEPKCSIPEIRAAIGRLTTIDNRKQVFVTFSAGNDTADAGYNQPGCIDSLNVFTVSSINVDSTCARFANWGSPPVDFVTVGTRVFSLWKNGHYRLASGTSVSSAILAGIIHAKGAAPTSSQTVTCKDQPYIIATWR